MRLVGPRPVWAWSLRSVMAGTPGLGELGLSRILRFKFGVVGVVGRLEQLRSPLIKE